MDTLLALFTAHLLADFLLQTKKMAAAKGHIPLLLAHSVVVVAVSALLLGSLHPPILLTIGLTHFLIDFLASQYLRNGLGSFLAEQGAHLAIIMGVCILYPTAFNFGFWPQEFSSPELRWLQALMVLLSSVALIAPVGGIFIEKLVRPIREEIDADPKTTIDGLRNGGKYIGWLERLLTLFLILIHQPMGIGFLLASKSILRLGEIKNGEQRKTAEYIIIGTFLSFGWALLVSLLSELALLYWFPANN